MMIERLPACLRALRELPAGELASATGAALRGECADALRLQLDCMQQELGAAERQVLTHLDDVLEAPDAEMGEVARAADAAMRVMESRWTEATRNDT